MARYEEESGGGGKGGLNGDNGIHCPPPRVPTSNHEE